MSEENGRKIEMVEVDSIDEDIVKESMKPATPSPHPGPYIQLMNRLASAYAMAANQCEAQQDFDRGIYYRGKYDATVEAMQHFTELMR